MDRACGLILMENENSHCEWVNFGVTLVSDEAGMGKGEVREAKFVNDVGNFMVSVESWVKV